MATVIMHEMVEMDADRVVGSKAIILLSILLRRTMLLLLSLASIGLVLILSLSKAAGPWHKKKYGQHIIITQPADKLWGKVLLSGIIYGITSGALCYYYLTTINDIIADQFVLGIIISIFVPSIISLAAALLIFYYVYKHPASITGSLTINQCLTRTVVYAQAFFMLPVAMISLVHLNSSFILAIAICSVGKLCYATVWYLMGRSSL